MHSLLSTLVLTYLLCLMISCSLKLGGRLPSTRNASWARVVFVMPFIVAYTLLKTFVGGLWLLCRDAKEYLLAKRRSRHIGE